ncbi:MAG TPA: exo-alpha-sialidase [Candidatus Hydrogenedentes bacterium]|nr:exo-alpha-sialidase [Candidatus Hydrogenedentota bacterium]
MRKILSTATLIALVASIPTLAQVKKNPERDNIETYRIFGPEHPGIYKHPASITELANGDMYIAYYGGSDEYSTDTAVYGSRLKKGELQWTAPQVIADTPDHGDGNPVIWQAPDGVVWLFYNNIYGTTWSDARVIAKMSHDGAVTWTDPIVINFEAGSMVRGQPIVLNNGDYLLPMYFEAGNDPEMTSADTCSYFMRYNPKEKTWKETNRIKSPTGNLQAQVVQISDEYLICYIRRGGNFLPTETGYAIRSESRDGGYTWSDGVDTPFKNPNSALDLIKLKSGNLLMVYNDNMNERTPLTVAISTDNDKTWAYSRDILGGDNTYAYPYAIQRSDGKIVILYTTNARTTIMLSIFNESAILESKW